MDKKCNLTVWTWRTMMRNSLLLAAYLTITSILGCASNRPVTQEVQAPYASTRVLVGECLFLKGAGESAVVPAIAGLAIDKAFNIVAAGLRAAGEEKKEYLSGVGNFDKPSKSFNGSCVTIVQGRFYSSVSQVPEEAYFSPTWAASTGLDKEKLKSLAKWHYVYLVDKPDFIMESVIVSTSHSGVFTLRPLYALLNRPVEKPWADVVSRGRRHVAMLFSFFAAGEDPTAAANPGTEIVLGEMVKEQPLIFRFPDRTQWARAVLSSGEVSTPYIQWPNEGRFFKLDVTKFSGPATVRVVVTQTKSESKLLMFLADAFDSVKKEISDEAKQAIIPSVAREADIAELRNKLSQQNAYDTALNEALAALDKCANSLAAMSSSSDLRALLALAQTARTEQDEANIIAKINRFPAPFSVDELISRSTQSAKADCRRVLTTKLGSHDGSDGQTSDDPAASPE